MTGFRSIERAKESAFSVLALWVLDGANRVRILLTRLLSPGGFVRSSASTNFTSKLNGYLKSRVICRHLQDWNISMDQQEHQQEEEEQAGVVLVRICWYHLTKWRLFIMIRALTFCTSHSLTGLPQDWGIRKLQRSEDRYNEVENRRLPHTRIGQNRIKIISIVNS